MVIWPAKGQCRNNPERLGVSYRLGVDVGGTFTDLLLVDEENGRFWRHKTPSTPADSSEGVMNGVNAICAEAGVSPLSPAEYDIAQMRRKGLIAS